MALDLKGNSASQGLGSPGGEAEELAGVEKESVKIGLFFKQRGEPPWLE